jgi:TolB-like protein
VTDKSIAVLPFVNMSSDKDQEFFSDGISEELLNVLAKVPQLQVAARTSSFSFKGKPVEIPEIARQLHVANVLEGSVRKSGDQVRITAQLIRAAEGYHLWSETYDRKLDDIFKIQDEIAGEVVKQLKVTLLGAAPTVRQTDPRAYELYLQAVQLGRQATPEAYRQSDALFKQVLEIDPSYAPAWAELGSNFVNKINEGLLPASEGYARGREAEEKAWRSIQTTRPHTPDSVSSRTITMTALTPQSTSSAPSHLIRVIWTCAAMLLRFFSHWAGYRRH